MKKLFFTLIFLIPWMAYASDCCIPGVVAGSNPSVTAVCAVNYNNNLNMSLTGQTTSYYDLFYLTSDGPNSGKQDAILTFVHGGGNVQKSYDVCEGQLNFFVQMAQRHFDVYAGEYFYTAYATLRDNITASSTTFPIGGDTSVSAYWPTAAPYTMQVGNDTMTVTSQSGSYPSFTVTVTRAGNAVSHSSTSYVYEPDTFYPIQAQSVACFQAYLGHFAGTNGVPGNPMDIRTYSYSAGTLEAFGNVLYGAQILNPTYCPWTAADYANTKVTRLLMSAPVNDIGCVTHYITVPSSQTPTSWVGQDPVSATFGSDCTVSSPNSGYTHASSLSPAYCLPGSVSCLYNPPTFLTIPIRQQIGTNDTTVTIHPATALSALWPSVTTLTCAGCTHNNILTTNADDVAAFMGQGSEVPDTSISGNVNLKGNVTIQ